MYFSLPDFYRIHPSIFHVGISHECPSIKDCKIKLIDYQWNTIKKQPRSMTPNG